MILKEYFKNYKSAWFVPFVMTISLVLVGFLTFLMWTGLYYPVNMAYIEDKDIKYATSTTTFSNSDLEYVKTTAGVASANWYYNVPLRTETVYDDSWGDKHFSTFYDGTNSPDRLHEGRYPSSIHEVIAPLSTPDKPLAYKVGDEISFYQLYGSKKTHLTVVGISNFTGLTFGLHDSLYYNSELVALAKMIEFWEPSYKIDFSKTKTERRQTQLKVPLYDEQDKLFIDITIQSNSFDDEFDGRLGSIGETDETILYYSNENFDSTIPLYFNTKNYDGTIMKVHIDRFVHAPNVPRTFALHVSNSYAEHNIASGVIPYDTIRIKSNLSLLDLKNSLPSNFVMKAWQGGTSYTGSLALTIVIMIPLIPIVGALLFLILGFSLKPLISRRRHYLYDQNNQLTRKDLTKLDFLDSLFYTILALVGFITLLALLCISPYYRMFLSTYGSILISLIIIFVMFSFFLSWLISIFGGHKLRKSLPKIPSTPETP